MWHLKDDTNELIYERNRLTDIENRHVAAKGVEGRARNGVGVSKCKPLYVGWINTKVLLYSIL